jgi:hypothetical protein
VNEVGFTYSAYGKVIRSDQSHGGAVVAGTTPAVTYIYADDAVGGIAPYVRLTAIGYPTAGRAVYPQYPAAGTLGAHLVRPSGLSEDATGTQPVAQYTYLGVSRLVRLVVPPAGSLALD